MAGPEEFHGCIDPGRRAFVRGLAAGPLLLAPLPALARLIPAAKAAAGRAADFRFLDRQDAVVMERLVPVLLAGILPPPASTHVAGIVHGIDDIIMAMSPAVRAELRGLFDLLTFAPTRIVLAGVWSAWAEASDADIAAFLDRWKDSPWQVFRVAYAGLHDVTVGAWYDNPHAWPAIGYPGPPEIG